MKNYPVPVLVAVSVAFCALIISANGAADVNPEILPYTVESGENKMEPVREEVYNAGPHQDLECTRCHRDKGRESVSGESVTGDSISLCRGCHKVRHLHPVGLDPYRQAATGRENFPLPLGKGILEGQIACLTCHAVHQHEYNPHLLRGENGTYQSVRNSLCFTCHTDHFSGKSPHTSQPERCLFCHLEAPREEEPETSTPDLLMQAACSLCHVNIQSSHFAGTDPFIDLLIWERAEQAGNFFAENQVVCTSCHVAHPTGAGPAHLRRDYLELCRDSRAIDPHWKDYLCVSCHLVQPAKNDAPLRENGDKNLVCNRCHYSEYARPDIHPVDVVPSEHIRVPEDMPLQDGKLSCETCHECRLQMGARRKNYMRKFNPNFLRKTQMSRNSYCFLCHLEESYKRLNPHRQLDPQGKIVEETCLFCHASIPDVHFIGPDKVSFIIYNPDEYCVGCHHGFTVNHPAGVNHLIEPSGKILRAIQTSVQRIGVELPLFNKKIVCATCHNPHEEGVIIISAAATGAKRENKLRLKPGRSQCTGCHWDK